MDHGLAVQDGEGGNELVRQVMSAVGQADDVGLLSSSLKNLTILLHLIEMYCEKFQVKLVGSKTKLLSFNTKVTADQAAVELATTTISVAKQAVHPTSQAAHVGVIRASWTECLLTGSLCLLSCMEDQPGVIGQTQQQY